MTDPSGIVAGTGCTRDRPDDLTSVLCPYAKNSFGNEVDLGGGNDKVRFVGDPLQGAAVAVKGGAATTRSTRVTGAWGRAASWARTSSAAPGATS